MQAAKSNEGDAVCASINGVAREGGRLVRRFGRMDLKHPGWMYLKAILLVLIGAVCFLLVWSELPTIRTAVLLALMVWACCRAYYFAFYVVEKYVDPAYRFSGLLSFLAYVLKSKK